MSRFGGCSGFLRASIGSLGKVVDRKDENGLNESSLNVFPYFTEGA